MKELYEKAGKPTGLPSDRKAFGRLGRRLKKMYDERKQEFNRFYQFYEKLISIFSQFLFIFFPKKDRI